MAELISGVTRTRMNENNNNYSSIYSLSNSWYANSNLNNFYPTRKNKKSVKFNNISNVRYFTNNTMRNNKVTTKLSNGSKTRTRTRKIFKNGNNIRSARNRRRNENKQTNTLIENIRDMLEKKDYLQLQMSLNAMAQTNIKLYAKIMEAMTIDEKKLINRIIQLRM